MDTLYLKNNINAALNEALTSMVCCTPDDNVEYLGRYLQQYVSRKQAMADADISLRQADIEATKDIETEAVKAAAEQELVDKATSRAKKLTLFRENLGNSTTKQEAMDSATKFIATFLDVPSAYFAINKKTEESETLLYFSESGTEIMKGQKLPKAAGGEEEDAPQRQGITFDCFIIPEAPEEEAPPDDEGEAPPPKPAPTAQPLVVDNTMRETRCKFFGIPKLGSFVAIPVMYDSSDHEGGMAPGPTPEEAAPPAEGEDEAAPAEPAAPPPKYVQSMIPLQTALCMDTVGKYRRFTESEIEVAKQVGDALATAFKSIELREFEKHCGYVDEAATNTEIFTTTLPASITEAETAALAAVAEESAVLPDTSDKEAHIAQLNAKASFESYDKVIKDDKIMDALATMGGFILPPVPGVLYFMHLLAGFVGFDIELTKDVCGDLSWSAMRANILPTLTRNIQNFQCSIDNENNAMNDETCKAFIESKGLADVTILGTSFSFLPLLHTWLNKAIASRDADKAYMAAQAEAEAARLAAEAEAAGAGAGEGEAEE
jgi:hypothetical protein